MDYEKAIKNAKWFAVGILVLALIMFCIKVFGGTSTSLAIILGIAQLVVIIATIKGLNDKQMYGSVCGIMVSVLLMFNRDIISIIFGILYLIDCIKLVNYMKNNSLNKLNIKGDIYYGDILINIGNFINSFNVSNINF